MPAKNISENDTTGEKDELNRNNDTINDNMRLYLEAKERIE